MGRSVAPGRVLGGRYRLDHEIARGGMATVWRGEDPLLARPVAVKTLDEVLADDDDLRVRFRREAVAAARVTHPNIVATFDTGEDEGVAYIVMELVDGATLRQAIDLHGALPPARAADIAAQVADALSAAHGGGLVHRDVKPSNVLVQLDGRVKVTDFGIAKAADQSADELTRVGNVMGTARYLAPEQLDGRPVDERTDVYSLGLVLFEMLAGSPPFGADTELATAMARLTTEPPRIATVRPDIAPGLAHIVDRAITRDPAGRWPTAAAMRDALAPFRVAAPDRTADATMPVALPPRPAAPAAAAHPPIISDGIGVGARFLAWFVAIAIGFGAGYAGYLLASDDTAGTSGPSGREGAGLLPIVQASAFDPEGGDGEHNDEAPNVIDGDRVTEWTTETYFQSDVGGKAGVGLVVELAGPAAIHRVDLVIGQVGGDVDIYVSDSAGVALADWGFPAAVASNLGAIEQIALADRPVGQFVLVWMTRLPEGAPADGGQARYVGRVSEVAVRGVER